MLTTNRPEHLEAALASRPGRIDQAIEFPLPDDQGRRRLIRLYACGLALTDERVELVVKKTKNASPAFIKELMRRCAQYCLQNGGSGALESQALDAALEEMLFTGGSLNAKLLGASGWREGIGNVPDHHHSIGTLPRKAPCFRTFHHCRVLTAEFTILDKAVYVGPR